MASRLLCCRVRTVKEAYEVRRAATLAVPPGCWQHVWDVAGACKHVGSATVLYVPLLPHPSVALLAPQEWYIGRWPSGPVVASIESIRTQPGQVLGHVNSLAISKCRWLPELIRATVPLAGSEAEAIRWVTLCSRSSS